MESLRITKDNISNRSTELVTPETEEMSTAPAPAGYNENVSTTTPKSMVPDLGWFDGSLKIGGEKSDYSSRATE